MADVFTQSRSFDSASKMEDLCLERDFEAPCAIGEDDSLNAYVIEGTRRPNYLSFEVCVMGDDGEPDILDVVLTPADAKRLSEWIERSLGEEDTEQ